MSSKPCRVNACSLKHAQRSVRSFLWWLSLDQQRKTPGKPAGTGGLDYAWKPVTSENLGQVSAEPVSRKPGTGVCEPVPRNQAKSAGCVPPAALLSLLVRKKVSKETPPEAWPCCAGFPASHRWTTAGRKLAALRQFALLVAVHPFDSGGGTRGRLRF